MVEVRPAVPADVDQIAATYARAFADDPVWLHLFPDERRRERGSTRLFAALVRAHLGDGETLVEVAGGGAAVWTPPGRWRMGPATLLRHGPAMAAALGLRTARVLGDLQRLERFHGEAVGDDHLYLAILGTDPSRQGQGVGTALVEPVLARCDRDGLPAYLESSKELNLPYYRRFGFEVLGELRFRGGPPVWPMLRTPVPPGG